MSRAKPDYGLDAPGVFGGLFTGGLAAAILGFLLVRWALSRHAGSVIGLAFLVENSGIGCLVGAALMFASSRFGKLRARDRILDRLNLCGDEAVLDLGCGRGLLLLGAAKRLPQGRAVGIDLWSKVDQSNNSREATRRSKASPSASKSATATCANCLFRTARLTPPSPTLPFTIFRAAKAVAKQSVKSFAFSSPAVRLLSRT